MSGYTCWT
jgi:hypothetical protein